MMTNTLEKIMRARSELARISLIYAGTALLTLCAVYCTLGVLVSGFDFAVNMGEVFLVVLISAFTVNAIAMIFRGWGVLALFVPVLVVCALNHEVLSGELKWFVYSITERYSRWTLVPLLFPEYAADTSEHLLFFSFAGVVISFLLSVTICLKRSTALTLLSTLPVVLLSFVLVETQADAIYLTGIIAAYLTLLVSNTFYPDNFSKSGLALIPAFVLAAAFTGLIYIASPPERYERSARAETIRWYAYQLAEQASGYLFQTPGVAAVPQSGWTWISDTGMWSFNTSEANIADAGARIITNRELLEIQVSQPGTFYLRGFSMGAFDGRAWQPEQGADGSFDKLLRERPALLASVYSNLYALGQEPDAGPPLPLVAGMNIRRVEDITNADYMPYYPGGAYITGDAVGGIMDYSVRFFHIPGSARAYLAGTNAAAIGGDEAMGAVISRYTQIDDATAEGLRELAQQAGIDITAPRESVADAVAAYVRLTAGYTLTPAVIPEGADFALHFLQTSKEGYCIHFATAATLMLRALDIPARFTSGYVVTVPQADAGRPIALTDENAHAWVEVLYDDAGWLPLEATPSSGGSAIPAASRPHTPSEERPAATPPSPVPDPSPAPLPQTNENEMPPRQPGQPGMWGGTGSAADTGSRRPEVPAWLIRASIYALAAAIIAMSLAVRRQVIAEIRNKRFTQRDTNAAVISMWQYACRLCRGQAIPPSDIEQLALKARFSQHLISEQERYYVLAYVRRLAAELYDSKDEYSRLWFKYIRALG